MDIYHIWFDLKPGESDWEFAEHLRTYLGRLQADDRIARYRLTRCKLGFRPEGLGEFHVMVETRDMAQLETAFTQVATRSDPIEALHHAVNSRVASLRFALYRDFPDPVRCHGEERF